MLQSQGWQLSVDEDYDRGTMQLALFHPSSDLKMLADEVDYNYYPLSAYMHSL